MAVMDIRTPHDRIEDERRRLRRPLETLLKELGDLTVTNDMGRAHLVSLHVGHDVGVEEVRGVIDLINLRDTHSGTQQDIDDRYEAVDVALDELLDMEGCDDCHGLHPADEVRRCDHGTFGIEGNYPTCWTSFHHGHGCPSEHLS